MPISIHLRTLSTATVAALVVSVIQLERVFPGCSQGLAGWIDVIGFLEDECFLRTGVRDDLAASV